MVELIFLHLPKTGGSSILEVLKLAYGESHVRHFERDECLELNGEGRKISEVIGPEVKVIHGHIRYLEVKDIVKRDKPSLVTFFREPVSRVISNYNWWKFNLMDKPEHPAYNRRNEELGTYIESDITQNKMTFFLKGSRLKEFDFIGFLESFDSDLQELGERMEWPAAPDFHEKNSASFSAKKPTTIDDKLRKRIEKLNKKDIALYKKALKTKKA